MPRRSLSAALVHTPFLQGLSNIITEPWRKHLADTADESNVVPAITRVSIPARNSAITTTPIPSGPLAEGLYRVTTYLRIVTVAVTSSSAQPSITFTDGATVCTFTGTAVTGNLTTSVGTNTFLVRITGGTPISYAVAYASNGAGEMAYDLEIVLEQIG